MRAYNFFSVTKVHQIFLFNTRVILLDNAIDRLLTSQFVPEIFVVKAKSCSTSRQILDVFAFPKF